MHRYQKSRNPQCRKPLAVQRRNRRTIVFSILLAVLAIAAFFYLPLIDRMFSLEIRAAELQETGTAVFVIRGEQQKITISRVYGQTVRTPFVVGEEEFRLEVKSVGAISATAEALKKDNRLYRGIVLPCRDKDFARYYIHWQEAYDGNPLVSLDGEIKARCRGR